MTKGFLVFMSACALVWVCAEYIEWQERRKLRRINRKLFGSKNKIKDDNT